MPDVLGQAIHDYHYRLSPSKLVIHNKFGTPDVMPVASYFRGEEIMPDLELEALAQCKGRVLDIGAGAGSHTIYLQHEGYDVTALELSALAAGVMKSRGVKKIINTDVFNYTMQQYDTLLLLMNGIGLVSNIEGLHSFLQHARRLLTPGGQLLFDSSDVGYLYHKNIPEMSHYYGEVEFRYEYKKQKTNWFTWLYIHKEYLVQIAREEGFTTEIIFEDDHDQYLAKLTNKTS